jgi:hypothetical protein
MMARSLEDLSVEPEVKAYEGDRQKPKFGKQVSLKLMQALAFTTKHPSNVYYFKPTIFHPPPTPLAFSPSQPQYIPETPHSKFSPSKTQIQI